MNEPEAISELPTDPKQRLLRVAEEVFASKGQEAASVREICAKAGLNIAAINYHFGTKERLYIETVKAAHCTLLENEFPPWPEGTPPEEKLRGFIRTMVGHMMADARPSAVQLVMREMALPTAATEAVVRDNVRPLAQRLVSIICELLPNADDSRTLMVGFSVIGQVLFYRQNRAASKLLFGAERVERLTVEMVAEHVTTVMLAAVEALARGDTP